MDKATYEQLDRIEALLSELVVIQREAHRPIYVKLEQEKNKNE